MLKVTALVFDGKKTASKALDTPEKEAPHARRWVEDVVVISRSNHGYVRSDSIWAQHSDSAGGFNKIPARR